MLGFLLTLICVTILFLKYLNNKNTYWETRNTKYVKGILWKLLMGKESLSETLKRVYDDNPDMASVGFFLGPKPALVLRDVENIRAVLHGDFQNFYARGLNLNATDILADNLLFAEDYNRWKLLRHKASLVFATKKLRNMFDTIDKCGRDFVKSAEENPKLLEDPFKAIYTYSATCISSSSFGVDKETADSMKISFEEMACLPVKASIKLNLKFALLNISQHLFKWLNIKFFDKYEDFWVQFLQNILKKHRNNNEVNYDYIESLIKLEDEGVTKDFVTGYQIDVTNELIAAQAFVFILGGIESTANTIHFTLLELSNNPKILQKHHEEIDEIFESNGGSLKFEDVDNLKYMEMVVNEAMRKYPPVGTMQRRCCNNTILPAGKVLVEKDTIVFIPVFAVHRDEKLFPNPDVFDPERFSPENILKIKRFSFMPFGEGHRNCVGMRLARIEVKVGIAWLLSKYTLKEQSYTPGRFEPSFFSLRDPDATYEIIPRTQA